MQSAIWDSLAGEGLARHPHRRSCKRSLTPRTPFKYCSPFIFRGGEVWSALTLISSAGASPCHRISGNISTSCLADLITGCWAASKGALALKGTAEPHRDGSSPNKLGSLRYARAHVISSRTHLTESARTICSGSTRTGRASSALVRRRSSTETE